MPPTPAAVGNPSASDPAGAWGPAPLYLDHHATTPCDPRVIEAMRPFFGEAFGNPASRTHALGWQADGAVEEARRQVATAIGATPREIVFTSGATEANNLAILGLARALPPRAAHAPTPHLITCQIEHRSVLEPCRALEREGHRVTRVGVDPRGHIDLGALERAIEPGTFLISVVHANSEIGVVQALAPIAALARARGIRLHTDAAQSVGKIPVDVRTLGVDLLSLSAHKLYGPKGVGALFVRHERPPLRLEPLLYGGGQERGLRSGTLAVPLCVGLGAACEIAGSDLESEAERLRGLREHLWARLSEIPDVGINGDLEARLPGSLNVWFGGIDAEALLLALPDVALSTGSACTSARREPSAVLGALGLSQERALGSVRFGLGRSTSREQLDRAASRVREEVERLRALAPPRRRRSSGARRSGRRPSNGSA